MSCSICIEVFTKQPHRKQACCPYCDIQACTKCTQTYLMGTPEDAHCMGCRRGWTREVLDSILLTTWINGAYKTHREDILFDRERSRLPAAQIIVERRKKAHEREPLRQELLLKITELDKQVARARDEYYIECRRIEMYNRGEDPFATTGSSVSTEERRVFVMPCPGSGCRGFLSQAYKCGVCDIYVCPDCREIKGSTRDADHTCNPDTVATVQRLKKECRGCPECGTNIFKIEGCDQMFCTNCNTPFSWTTGKKITTGAIHNPHYFEFLRAANGGNMPRNPGDIPCIGNLPTAWTFDREVNRKYPIVNDIGSFLYTALITITHIQHVEIPSMTNRAEDSDNTDINVRYLMNEIDQKQWKQLMQQKEKKRIKKDEVRMRYEAFVGACVDIYGRVIALARPVATDESLIIGKNLVVLKACEEAQVQLIALKNIFNSGMMDISKRYKCTVLQLSDTIKRTSAKYESGRVKRTKDDTESVATTEEPTTNTIVRTT